MVNGNGMFSQVFDVIFSSHIDMIYFSCQKKKKLTLEFTTRFAQFTKTPLWYITNVIHLHVILNFDYSILKWSNLKYYGDFGTFTVDSKHLCDTDATPCHFWPLLIHILDTSIVIFIIICMNNEISVTAKSDV